MQPHWKCLEVKRTVCVTTTPRRSPGEATSVSEGRVLIERDGESGIARITLDNPARKKRV